MVTGLLPRASSVFSLLYSRITFLGMALPTVGRTHQPRKCSTSQPLNQYDGGIFLIENASSQMTLACTKLSKTKNNMDMSITLKNLEHKLDSVVYKYI